jgi:Cu/Ag efflux protein CusF
MKSILGRLSLIVILFLFVGVASRRAASAQEDVVHIASGIVKHIDRDTRTIVVKTDEGVEHTVKWTDKTTWEGTKESGKGIKDGSKVAVKYTEKAGEKTAVGIKDAAKDTGKALQ